MNITFRSIVVILAAVTFGATSAWAQACGPCAPMQAKDKAPCAAECKMPDKCDTPCASCVVGAAKPQTTCPVMGRPINKQFYADVAGRRVYVCCQGCIEKVKAEPQKYIQKIIDKGETPELLPITAEINTAALAVLIRAGVPIVILDARTGKYDDGRRIPGAKSLSPEAKPEDIAKVAGDKNRLIVTYCSNTKCPASKQLAARLRSLGYANVLEYPEGIQGWAEAGNEVQRKL